MSAKTFWENAQEEIKDSVGKTSYDTWFSAIEVVEKGPENLLIEAPDDFFKSWLVEHYQKLIEDTLCRHAGSPINVEFSVNPHVLKKSSESAPTLACVPPKSSTARMRADGSVPVPKTKERNPGT